MIHHSNNAVSFHLQCTALQLCSFICHLTTVIRVADCVALKQWYLYGAGQRRLAYKTGDPVWILLSIWEQIVIGT
jgi:hypothetical protein